MIEDAPATFLRCCHGLALCGGTVSPGTDMSLPTLTQGSIVGVTARR